MIYKPFAFQEEGIVKGLEVLMSPKERLEVLVAATAAGKSIIIAELAKRLPKNGNILVIQPSKELLKQNLEKIESSGIFPAVNSDSMKRREIGRITYATPKSLKVSAFKDKNFKYMIIDECDIGTQGKSVLKAFKKSVGIKNVLGLTASPIYLKNSRGGAQLKIMTRVRDKFFNNICHVIQIQDMLKLKRWSEIKYKSYEFDRTGLILNSNGSDYTEQSIIDNFIESDMESKISSVVDSIEKGEKILIFVPSIKNVEALSKRLGHRAVCVHSDMNDKERDLNIKLFKQMDSGVDVMINALIFTAGFDFPQLLHIIDAYATKSARVHIQKIGRIVRIHDTKSFGTVHDLVDNTGMFGRVEDINFCNIEGYGWGMFSGDILLTGVPISENLNITKQMLKEGKGKKPLNNFRSKTESFDFVYNFDNKSPVIPFGKYKNKTVEEVYNCDKGYLKWISDPKTNFNFGTNVELKNSILSIFKT